MSVNSLNLQAIQDMDTSEHKYLEVVTEEGEQHLSVVKKGLFGRIWMCLGFSNASMKKVAQYIAQNEEKLQGASIDQRGSVKALQGKIGRYQDRHSSTGVLAQALNVLGQMTQDKHTTTSSPLLTDPAVQVENPKGSGSSPTLKAIRFPRDTSFEKLKEKLSDNKETPLSLNFFYSDNFSDDWLKYLEKFPKIYKLNLGYCNYTKKGLLQLTDALPHLKELDMFYPENREVRDLTLKEIEGLVEKAKFLEKLGIKLVLLTDTRRCLLNLKKIRPKLKIVINL